MQFTQQDGGPSFYPPCTWRSSRAQGCSSPGGWRPASCASPLFPEGVCWYPDARTRWWCLPSSQTQGNRFDRLIPLQAIVLGGRRTTVRPSVEAAASAATEAAARPYPFPEVPEGRRVANLETMLQERDGCGVRLFVRLWFLRRLALICSALQPGLEQQPSRTRNLVLAVRVVACVLRLLPGCVDCALCRTSNWAILCTWPQDTPADKPVLVQVGFIANLKGVKSHKIVEQVRLAVDVASRSSSRLTPPAADPACPCLALCGALTVRVGAGVASAQLHGAPWSLLRGQRFRRRGGPHDPGAVEGHRQGHCRCR